MWICSAKVPSWRQGLEMRCQISSDDSNEDKVSFLPGLPDSTVKVNGQALVDSGPEKLDRFIMNKSERFM